MTNLAREDWVGAAVSTLPGSHILPEVGSEVVDRLLPPVLISGPGSEKAHRVNLNGPKRK